MYRILRFVAPRGKAFQKIGDTIATYATHGEAQSALETLRDPATRRGDTFYRVQCDPTAAMLAYRETLTECERALSAIQLADDDSDRATQSDRLSVAAARLAIIAGERMAEIATLSGKDGR